MTLDEFLSCKGKLIGVSDWVEITQADIDTFGHVTKDLEPMHNDPDWCAQNSPYERTIAYGFQTISLLTALMHSATKSLFSGTEGNSNFPLNYGFNRLRLINPVKVGEKVRASFALKESNETRPGELLSILDVNVEIEGQQKPALVAEWLVYWISEASRLNVTSK